MQEETPARGRTMIDDMSRTAKSMFQQVSLDRLVAFIEAQPDVTGPVTLEHDEYLTDGPGASNGVLLFTASYRDTAGEQRTEDLVLRYSGAEELMQKSYGNEFMTIRAAHDAGLPVPAVRWLDEDGSQLGTAGFVMQRIRGVTPAAGPLSSGLLRDAAPERRHAMMLAAAGFHGRLRAAAIGPDRVPHLLGRGSGTTAVEREVGSWFHEAESAGEPLAEELGFLGWAHDLLVENQRVLYPEVLVHGDSQFANVMFSDGEVVAAIDWEFSYLGHNEADLALIAYLTEWHAELSGIAEGIPSEAEYLARFEEASGTKVQHWEYFRTFIVYKALATTYIYRQRFGAHFDEVWRARSGHLRAEARRARLSG